MSAPVGADVESICHKCGDVWHVVVAKVGDKIVRVQCKQCGAVHRPKPPGGAAAAPSAPVAKRAPAGPRTPRPAAAPAPIAMPAFDPSKPPRPYRITDTFEVGERIAHPTFGTGVVKGSPGPGKIEVVFASGVRILAQAKEASTLARPADAGRGGVAED